MREEEILGATDKVRALEEQSAKTAGTSHSPNVCCAPRSLAFWKKLGATMSSEEEEKEKKKEKLVSQDNDTGH
ncbi:hypothetical protein TYRP_007858 [Tyrophagus putrescentiae]|nr:hypothetical protein TYRP_007858 [Tyrophagus putrescentiae]